MVTRISCALPGHAPDAPGLSGVHIVRLVPGSIAGRAYGACEAVEAFSCNYGLNPEFQSLMMRGGLRISGVGEGGEARVVELCSHPFYVATQFRPQLSSAPGRPHPLITAYLAALTASRN